MFDQVKTVQDLVELNNQQPENDPNADIVKNLIHTILDEEPAVGLAIVDSILLALSDFHAQAVNMYVAKNDSDHAAQWAHDLAQLNIARKAIEDIIL